MNQNSLLALVTLIALLWINGGDCLKGRQNENEVDIAKRQKALSFTNERPNKKPVDCSKEIDCATLRGCWKECKAAEEKGNGCPVGMGCRIDTTKVDYCMQTCYQDTKAKKISFFTILDCKDYCKVGTGKRDEAEMADEDEADEAKSDEVDIAKRQKGLKILKAWKRDEAEMAAVDEADEDKAQN